MWFGNGLKFSDEVCDHLDNGDHEEEQKYVQTVYSQVNLVVMYCQAIPPVVILIFLGPWSDRAGRRFLILFPLIGYMFNCIVFIIGASFFDSLPVEFLMLEVVQAWFGGASAIFMGS